MNRIKLGRLCALLVLGLTITLITGGIAISAEEVKGGNAGLININMATVKEIMTLPGIGKKKAEAIVAYRKENGGFNSVDELVKVDGIGKKTLEKIKESVITE